jgi:hypothetical protein
LRAIFGGTKSCALVNLFIICSPIIGWSLADDTKFAPDRGHVMAWIGLQIPRRR